jgi:hypothetical protein
MPTKTIPDKICSHCGGNKWYHDQKRDTYYCYVKQQDRRKAYLSTPEAKAKLKVYLDKHREKNKEKIAKYYRDSYEKNKEQYKIASHKYRQTEKGKAALKRAKNKQSENLTDYYIVNNYYINVYSSEGLKIDRKHITKEHIELQRNKIKLQRQLKQTNHGNS